MSKTILHIEKLSKSFGGLKLFNEVNIELQEGSINALFGNNGSGKTTFFNLIGGYEKPDAGKIHFNGLTIKYHNEFEIAKAGIGKMWQEPTVFPNHTVLQNLMVSDKTHPGELFLNYIFRGRTIHTKRNGTESESTKHFAKIQVGK
jgi:ABC-type branched-subunit amino acid transport system ATPase component